MSLLPSGWQLERVDLEEGQRAIQDAYLYDPDENRSEVQGRLGTDRMEAIWLVREPAGGVAVGMAMITRESFPCAHHRLNLFVDPNERGQGLGAALVRAAVATYPFAVGHYTWQSYRLYLAHGLRSVTELGKPTEHRPVDVQALEEAYPHWKADEARFAAPRSPRRRFR